MRSRSTLFLFFFCLFAVAAVCWYAWVLGAPQQRESLQMTATVDRGTAWVQHHGETTWEPIGQETLLTEGDIVKTDAASAAHIQYFSVATARLDANTKIEITHATTDADSDAHQEVFFHVLDGRVWNRVLKFLDAESSYSAQMSDVVATVRGTAFVMVANDPTGWIVRVADSTVGVHYRSSASSSEQRVSTGDEAWVTKASGSTTASSSTGAIARPRNDTGIVRRATAAEVQKEAWYQDNQQQDVVFERDAETTWRRRLERRAGMLPGSPLYGLKRLGEAVRLSLTSDRLTRSERALNFLDRRFAEIATLTAQGRKNEARQLFVDAQHRMMRLLQDAGDRQLTADVRERLCVALRHRASEQMQIIDRAHLAGMDGLWDVPADGTVRSIPRTLLFATCAQQQQVPDAAPYVPATSSPIATSTPSGSIHAVTTSTVVGATTLQLVPGRTILYTPDTQQLFAYVVHTDGTKEDITSVATWSVSHPDIASVSATGFLTTTSAGSFTVTALYQGKRVTQPIRVVGTVLTQNQNRSLIVSCTPNTIALYGRSSCTAQLTDTSTRTDVTARVQWSATSGVMSGSVFSAGQSLGTTTITATYLDTIGTVKGTTTVTVR